MPHSPRARPPDTADSIQLFAEHHIVSVRKQRRTGEIVAVKHAMYGWISPKEYYLLQKVHEAIPLAMKLIEGGYRLKEAMWSVSITILGTDVELPIGEGLMIAMATKIALSIKDKNDLEALKWAAMLALPFGDVAAIWILAKEAFGILDFFSQAGHPILLPPPILR